AQCLVDHRDLEALGADVYADDSTVHAAQGALAQTSSTSLSRDGIESLVGENEPSKIAEPMGKASTPARARACTRSGRSMLPATINPRPQRLARAARTSSSGSASVAR